MAKATGEEGENGRKITPAMWIAIIGLIGTIIAGLLSSPLLPILFGGRAADHAPSVRIEGPNRAVLGEKTYYTFISKNAVRAIWSIGGFSSEGNTAIEPLDPSHQIFVEPSNPERLGSKFTLAVTVYQEDGESATATKDFMVVEK